MIARKWVVADAIKMVVETTAFRELRQLDTLPLFPSAIKCRGYNTEELVEFHGRGSRVPSEVDRYTNQFKSCYASSWHKTDKGGRPLYIEKTGRINVKEFVRRSRQMVPPGANINEPCTVTHLHNNEVGGVLLRYADSKRPEGAPHIIQVSVIMDCDGFTLGHLFGPAMDILKAQSVMDQAYYPEGLHRLYVANAPTALSVAWGIVKGWLDPRVQKKVVIMKPGETKAKLLEEIDASCLPEFLGGTCNCEGGCLGCVDNEDAAADDDEFAENVCKTEVFKINARDKFEKTLAVEANTQTAWEYHTEDKLDINLSVSFTPAAGGDAVIVGAPERKTTGSGQYATTEAGTLTFIFDNSYSWMSKKTIAFLAASTTTDAK
ncbi:Hypothetical protein, putative [Bodo saltans]|uniref:CRAL-TRIO domain-containing protein n=1 Tax=Bodo saltans TaxID=75058 RepID=A0A0S4J7N0_BODSA|nr:Hypothetical protein, putative [Bodo saltans]|eukprot:CUG59121.1 Hypothetical protein, putative [Bodo saltans]